ncbi:MAG: hypothetical protein PHY85_10480 [Bacteroidales bacterium]|nr:hypothetical protein [Bacteroidales bacterium]
MNKKLFFPIIILLAFSFSACKKDRIEKSMNEFEDLNDYMNLKKQEEQTFLIDSNGTGPIIGNQGTKIWISKECLQTMDGNEISWPYIVKLVELYTPADMIYWQMPSVSTNGILQTEGEVRLRAFKDNNELKLKPLPCKCIVEMPSNEPKNFMSVYYGFETNNRPNWTKSLAQLGINPPTAEWFAPTDTGHIGEIGKLGWIACDTLVGSNSGATVNFVSTTDYLDNVGIFIYFPNTKTIMQVYDQASSPIPNGSSVKIICFAQKSDGSLYHFYSTAIINGNMEIMVEMQEISDPALTSLLNLL